MREKTSQRLNFIIIFFNLITVLIFFSFVLAWLLSLPWGRMRNGAPMEERTAKACEGAAQ